MKEEKIVRKKKPNFKGSVLFTVVAVMMVLIVFVMATLTIAGAANKRAYASYSKNQTTYTAQAAIEATIEAMKSDVNIAKSINALATAGNVKSSKELTVSGDDSLGDTTVVATNAGAIKQLDPDTGSTVSKYVIELAATTTLGDESSTVSTYYIVDPVTTTSTTTSNNNSGANGITVMGGLGNAPFQFNSYGGSSIGIGKDASRWVSVDANGYPTSSDYISYNFTNDHGDTDSGININGSLSMTTSPSYLLSPGEGIRIFGDFVSCNGSPKFKSIVGTSDYDSLPYIFVERNFKYTSGNGFFIGSEDEPWVVYCGGTFNNTGNNMSIYGDIYVYDHDFSKEKQDYSDYNEDNVLNGTSVISTANFSGSNLIKWANDLIAGSSEHTVGGDFYTKGSLSVSYLNVGNDCYVKGNLNVTGKVEIGGNLCVEGNITCGDLTVDGTVYCGGTVSGTIKNADGDTITDVTNTANKFDFPSDRDSLDDIMKLTTTDTTGINIIETQTVESSYYLDSEGEYVYTTEIPDAYLDAVNSVTYANSANIQYEMVPDSNGEYVKETWWDGSIHFRKKYYDGETSPDGFFYSQGEVISNVQQIPEKIETSCTISGSIYKDIVIDPGDNVLWIKLDNVYLDNHNIIVENEGRKGIVNFYVPENGTFQIINHGSVLTRSAYNNCYSNADLKSMYRDDDSDASKMIPNIYFYTGKNAELTVAGNNSGWTTAYIYAPYATVNISAKGSTNPKNYVDSYDVWNTKKTSYGKLLEDDYNNFYNLAKTYSVDSGGISVVGAVVADKINIMNSGDNANVFFVSNILAQKEDGNPLDDSYGGGSGEQIETVADGTNIKIVSSYANGSSYTN